MGFRKKQSRHRPAGQPKNRGGNQRKHKSRQKGKGDIKGKSRSNRWADHYSHQARKENYPARSVYKIKEIQKKHRLIRPGQRVLDLGCAPGAWLLFAAETVGAGGWVMGIDLKPVTIKLPHHARAVIGDIHDDKADYQQAIGPPVDVILSDLAPATTGNKIVDAARSVALCETALAFARLHLGPGGAFVCKIFQGADFKSYIENVKPLFRRCVLFKPLSSRKASREIYIIGKTFLGDNLLGGKHVGT